MTDFKQLFQQNYNNDIASAREFYFVKTQDALNAWRSLSIDDALLESLLKLDYEGFNQLAETDTAVKNIRESIFAFVSYCDTNAKAKDVYNEYPDNRSIAKAEIRKNA